MGIYYEVDEEDEQFICDMNLYSFPFFFMVLGNILTPTWTSIPSRDSSRTSSIKSICATNKAICKLLGTYGLSPPLLFIAHLQWNPHCRWYSQVHCLLSGWLHSSSGLFAAQSTQETRFVLSLWIADFSLLSPSFTFFRSFSFQEKDNEKGSETKDSILLKEENNCRFCSCSFFDPFTASSPFCSCHGPDGSIQLHFLGLQWCQADPSGSVWLESLSSQLLHVLSCFLQRFVSFSFARSCL